MRKSRRKSFKLSSRSEKPWATQATQSASGIGFQGGGFGKVNRAEAGIELVNGEMSHSPTNTSPRVLSLLIIFSFYLLYLNSYLL